MARRATPPPPPVTVLRGHSTGVQAVCFLSEHVLLSGSQDGVVKAWNLERRRVCAEFEATSRGCGVQRLDRLGRNRVVSQGRDGVIKVWDAERLAASGSDRPKEQISTHDRNGSRTLAPEPLLERATGAFHFCQFALTRWREEETTRDQEDTITGDNGECQGRHEEVREERGEEPRHEEQDESDCVSHNTFRAVARKGGERGEVLGESSANGDGNGEPFGMVRHEDMSEERLGGEGRQEVAAGATVGEGLSHDSFAENAMLAPCNEHRSMRLWDLRDPAPAYTIAPVDSERKGMVMCARLLGESPSCSSRLAVCGHDSGYLCVHDLRATSAGQLMESRLHKEPLLCVDVGSSCTQGVSGSADDSIHVFKIDTKKGSCEVAKTFRSQLPGTSCVEIRRDQKIFVSGGWDHRVRAFSWQTPRPLAVLRSHEGSVYGLAYSPRIGGLASGAADSRVVVWDLFPEGRRN